MRSQINPIKQSLLTKQFQNFSLVEEYLQQEESQLIQSLQQSMKKHKKNRKKNRKIVTSNQIGHDITQFFQFKKRVDSGDSSTSLISQLSGGHWAWLILVYSMFNNSLILPWMIIIDADKFLRQAWRHILLNVILIPFILFEKRTANEQKKKLYQWQNILKLSSLKNALLVSFSKGFWLIVILQTFQYTTIAHTLILGNLMNFFLSINRFIDNTYHFLEPGGQIFTIVGIFLIIKDQILMNVAQVSDEYQLTSFTQYNWQIRVTMDVIALAISLIMAMSYKYTTNLAKDYPSYLGMVIVNSIIALIMFFAAYFFHGATFDNDHNLGIFGLFTDSHFINFLQMSIFTGFGMIWSFAMISNLFPQPLIPSLATLFEPMISFMIMDFTMLQQIPSGYTVMGYIFVIPGTFLILVGQNIYQKTQKVEERKIEQRIKQIVQMSILRKQSFLSKNEAYQNQTYSPLLLNKLKKSISFLKQNEYSDVLPINQSKFEQNSSPQLNMPSLKQIISDKKGRNINE